MGYLPAAGLPAPGQNAGTPPGRLTTGPTLSTIRQRRPQAPGRNEWLKVPHLRALTSGIHPPLMGSSGWYTVYLPQSPSGACIPGGRGHCLSIYGSRHGVARQYVHSTPRAAPHRPSSSKGQPLGRLALPSSAAQSAQRKTKKPKQNVLVPFLSTVSFRNQCRSTDVYGTIIPCVSTRSSSTTNEKT